MGIFDRMFGKPKKDVDNYFEVPNRYGVGDGTPLIVLANPDLERVFNAPTAPIPQKLTDRNRGYWEKAGTAAIKEALAIAYLQHPNPLIRLNVIGYVRDVQTLLVWQALVDLLTDISPDVGKAAADLIWVRGIDNYCEFAVHALRDEIRGYSQLVGASALALGREKAIKALDLLVSSAPNEDARRGIKRLIDRDVVIEERVKQVDISSVTATPSSSEPTKAKGGSNVELITSQINKPTCTRCGKVLEKSPLFEGEVIGGTLPMLYKGLICTKCGKIECPNCKGAILHAPCSWCGGKVTPATEDKLKAFYKQQPPIQQDHNLKDGLELLKQGSNQCINKFLLFLESVREDLVLQEIELLNNTLISNGTPEFNKQFWKEVSYKYKNNDSVTLLLQALWAKNVGEKNARALSHWLEIYLKLDWNAGREWSSIPESDQVISEYVEAKPNYTDSKCLLIYGINNIEALSLSISALFMYIEDFPNTSLAPQVLQLVERKLLNNSTENETKEIKHLISQILKAVRKEIATDYIEFVRKVFDIYNKNNPSNRLLSP